MAHIEKNIVTEGLSGPLGKRIVFRTGQDGGTILATRPKFKGPPSEKQISHREKFQVAVLYAKTINANPELKAAYKAAAKPGVSAFANALADFMVPPKIKEVNMQEYTGEPGSMIIIRAIDNYRVREVHVGITDVDGKLVESGNAVKDPEGLDWIYTTTVPNNSLQGTKIEVSVTDTPGHTVTSVTTLE